MQRYAISIFSPTPELIDNLTYTYYGNKVVGIADDSQNPSGYEGGGGEIIYEQNGNMIAMPDKGITNIVYNFLNLPMQITQNGNTTDYLYRTDGVKLKKTFTLEGGSVINTEYLDGFQYSTQNTEPLRLALRQADESTTSAVTAGEEQAFTAMPDRAIATPAVIANPTPDAVPVILSFFPTAEGYFDYENMRYIYQYKDYLGNVRLSFTKDLKVMDRNDYYPFGMSFLKTSVSLYDPMAIPYNYKFGGKELQETGMYDFGNRNYMPDIGRWTQVDPLAEVNRRWSPYKYANNNPLRFIDPDGMDEQEAEQEMDKQDDERHSQETIEGKSIDKDSGGSLTNTNNNFFDQHQPTIDSNPNSSSDSNLHDKAVASLGDHSVEEPDALQQSGYYYKYNSKILYYNKDTIILQYGKDGNYKGVFILTRYKKKGIDPSKKPSIRFREKEYSN